MKLFTGSLAAGLVLLAAGAQAQVPYGNARSPYAAASDFDAPYAMAPPAIPGSRYRYGPSLLPSTEVYAVLRDNGFSPLGIPRLRGFVYTIAVIDRGGEDGRLVIDARNGRIIRFMPAYRAGDGYYNEESRVIQGSPGAPPSAHVMDSPQPPRPSAKVASRTVPVPKAVSGSSGTSGTAGSAPSTTPSGAADAANSASAATTASSTPNTGATP